MGFLVVPGVLMMVLGPLYALDGILGNNDGSTTDSILLGALIGLAGYGLAMLPSRFGRD